MTIPFVLNAEFFVQLSGIAYGTDATAYTNGFCLAQVMSALFGRIGWMQTTGNDEPTLNSTNLISRSGRYFNDSSFHALATLTNIKAVMEQKSADDTAFNSFLESLQRAMIMRCVNGVFNNPEFISQALMYRRWGYLDTPIANTGRFIAWRIVVPPVSDLATQIDTISLYFDRDCTFNLYLFNDAKAAPVWMQSVTAVAETQTVITLNDVVLNYIGGNNLGGIFYLGYFQNDLGLAQAIRESATNFKTMAPYSATMIEATPIGSNNFQRNNIGYTSYYTYGINMHLSVFRDHTQAIVKKSALFDNAIGMQMAAQCIELSMYSTRSNATERILKDSAQVFAASLDLTGTAPISDAPQTIGLRKQITSELTRVKDSFFPKAKPQSMPIC